MELNDAIRKIQLLRALSARAGTQEEAAAAAGKAATLMAQYELDEATVTDTEQPEPVASYFVSGEKRHVTWKSYVARAVSEAHGCRSYFSRGGFKSIGRKRDVQAAAYLYQLICADIERLAKQGWDNVKTTAYETRARWVNGFKMGAAVKVQNAIDASRRQTDLERSSMRQRARAVGEPEPHALVVLRKRSDDISCVARELKLTSGRRTAIRSWSGYDAGKNAKVNTGGNAVASLGPGRGRVTS